MLTRKEFLVSLYVGVVEFTLRLVKGLHDLDFGRLLDNFDVFEFFHLERVDQILEVDEVGTLLGVEQEHFLESTCDDQVFAADALG